VFVSAVFRRGDYKIITGVVCSDRCNAMSIYLFTVYGRSAVISIMQGVCIYLQYTERSAVIGVTHCVCIYLFTVYGVICSDRYNALCVCTGSVF